ncbi:hypothetical protein O181_089574 [Austropuccinia psidii MF-1]|uniref:Uncharacterized protein n=1 Tax=Austropuccinia psidii MF-1 TaxID=1389203 RepID=A0A9Q3P5S4_9BASI|nr:hypothetical protein [Austropuccinia psidii MF-1]
MDISLGLDIRYYERKKEKGIHKEKKPQVTGSYLIKPPQRSSFKRSHQKNKRGKKSQIPKDNPHAALLNKDSKLIGSEKERSIK